MPDDHRLEERTLRRAATRAMTGPAACLLGCAPCALSRRQNHHRRVLGARRARRSEANRRKPTQKSLSNAGRTGFLEPLRRRRDSNPRISFPIARLASVCLEPLGHLSKRNANFQFLPLEGPGLKRAHNLQEIGESTRTKIGRAAILAPPARRDRGKPCRRGRDHLPGPSEAIFSIRNHSGPTSGGLARPIGVVASTWLSLGRATRASSKRRRRPAMRARPS